MAYRDPSVSNGDIGYHPSDGELIDGYAERVLAICAQFRHDFLDHYKWWEHRGTKPCRICGYADMLEYLAEALQEVSNADPKASWSYKWEKTTQSPILKLHRRLLKY